MLSFAATKRALPLCHAEIFTGCIKEMICVRYCRSESQQWPSGACDPEPRPLRVWGLMRPCCVTVSRFSRDKLQPAEVCVCVWGESVTKKSVRGEPRDLWHADGRKVCTAARPVCRLWDIGVYCWVKECTWSSQRHPWKPIKTHQHKKKDQSTFTPGRKAPRHKVFCRERRPEGGTCFVSLMTYRHMSSRAYNGSEGRAAGMELLMRRPEQRTQGPTVKGRSQTPRTAFLLTPCKESAE